MYIYHAFINAMSAHVMHINLNMIFYTCVEHSSTKIIYIKYYTNKNKNKKALQTHTYTLLHAVISNHEGEKTAKYVVINNHKRGQPTVYD